MSDGLLASAQSRSPHEQARAQKMIVFVGYASAHGSTREIAERIAAKVTERGNRVELKSLDRIQDASRYDALVIGSAIHDQTWLPHATQFVESHIDTLSTQPVWLFSVGMPGAFGRPLRRLAETEGRKVIARIRDAILPRDHRLFSGVVHPEQLSFFGRTIFGLFGGHYGDFRDWKEIDAWAENIAHQLTASE